MLQSKRAKSDYCHTMLCEPVLFLQGWIKFLFSLCYVLYFDLLAFPYNICFQKAPTFTASCFHTPPFSCTYSQVFLVGGGDKVLFISRMHHRWLDLYFVWKSKMKQKTQRLSSCSDHLVQYCTKKWIKGQKLLSKEKCRSWALALVTLSSFTKQDRKKTYSSRTSMVIYCETVILLNKKKKSEKN